MKNFVMSKIVRIMLLAKVIILLQLSIFQNLLFSQSYQVGDLYVFPDSSKGIVCYVDPNYSNKGWCVSLNHLGRHNLLAQNSFPEGFYSAYTREDFTSEEVLNWQPEGKKLTKVLYESGVSPAAKVVDYYNGWYIPDAFQISKVYALYPFISNAVHKNAGNLDEPLKYDQEIIWAVGQEFYTYEGFPFPSYSMHLIRAVDSGYVIPVRDFGNESYAYWEAKPKGASILVKPDSTTSYSALVIYGVDTFKVSSSTIVHHPKDQDTIYEVSCVSSTPYNSQKSTSFTGLDISVPKSEYYVYRDTMQTLYGCDSIVTLMLMVVDDCDGLFFSDTICPIVDEYYFEPFDTIFRSGTISGIYTHQSIMDYGGTATVVTQYYDLTILPKPDITITCAPDVEKQIAFGECDFKVEETTLDEPTATHSLGWALEINAQLPADSMLAAGENTVMWIATDRCGNADTCTQKVTVTFPECPSVTDADGNTYESVRIGCDCWMQRNLESSTYADNSPISWAKGYESFMHPDADANIAVFGRLYDFASAVKDSADNGHGHVQGACPDGWHLPTPAQYSALLGMDATTLKTSEYWIDGGGNNSTGFAWLPAGRYNGAATRFEGLLASSWFWSVDGTGENLKVYSFCTRYSCDTVMEDSPANGSAYSIRCVKEKE